MLNKQKFQRKPFIIDAIEITEENIEEVANLIGKLMYRDDGTPYISINNAVIPKLKRAYIGFWLTVRHDQHRCYSQKTFNSQYTRVNTQATLFEPEDSDD